MSMTINKAIVIMTINNDHNPDYTDAERREAHQLGIEALQRVQAGRPKPPSLAFQPLTGETED